MDTKALRQKILDLAIRGKLVPQDPSDEPASALLERIREQKRQMVREGKLKAKDIKNDTVIFVGEDNLHYEKFPDGSVKCIEDEIPFEVPSGWEWTRLGSIAIVKGGKRIPKGMGFSAVKTNHAYIRVVDMKNNSVNLNTLKYVSNDVFEHIRNYTVEKNDLYITIAGTIGEVGVIPDELDGMNLTENAAKISSIQVNKNFLCLLLQSDFAKKQFTYKTYQVAMPKLGLERIQTVLIPVCGAGTQRIIADLITKLFNYIDIVQANKESIADEIILAKSRILDLAIRGKLVPQDPNDEPASILLERIRTEKEELIKQGKIKRDRGEGVIFKGGDSSHYEKIGDKVTCIDDEIPFEVPETWAWIRLKEVWELISGRDLEPVKYNSDRKGIPYITGASNFSNGKIKIERWTESPEVISEHGDLLITCKGTVGEMAFNDFGSAHIARQIMAIRNRYNLNIDYLRLCLTSFIDSIKSNAKGLIPGISREDLLNLLLPIPPNMQQAKIVDYVQIVFNKLSEIEKSIT